MMCEKVRVAFLIPGFGDGGAQKQFAYLVNALQKDVRFEIHVIHFYEGVHFKLLNLQRVVHHKLRPGSFYSPLRVIDILQVLQENRISLLFSWMHSCDIYAFFLKLALPRMKWILAERASDYPAGLRYQVRRQLGRFADFIIANSTAGKTYWQKVGVRSDRLAVVRNICEVVQRLRNHQGAAAKRVIYAGRLEAAKNVLEVCSAFEQLAREFSDVEFVMIGNGSMASDIQMRISASNLANLALLPFQENIIDHFLRASVFVNASIHEGSPNTVVENLALGNRVVLSRISPHEDLVGPDYPFFVEQPLNASQIILAVREALVRPSMEEDMTFARKVLSEMSADEVAGRYASVLLNLGQA